MVMNFGMAGGKEAGGLTSRDSGPDLSLQPQPRDATRHFLLCQNFKKNCMRGHQCHQAGLLSLDVDEYAVLSDEAIGCHGMRVGSGDIQQSDVDNACFFRLFLSGCPCKAEAKQVIDNKTQSLLPLSDIILLVGRQICIQSRTCF